MPGDTTIVLVRKAKEGDRGAFERLVNRYWNEWLEKFHGRVARTVRRYGDTEDLVNAALKSAWEDLSQLRQEGAFFTWVTTIIRRKIIKIHKKLKREPQARPLPNSDSRHPPAPETPPDWVVEEDEIYERMLDKILALFLTYPQEMAAVVLRELDSWSLTDIAERLGVTRPTVNKYLRRGIRLLGAA